MIRVLSAALMIAASAQAEDFTMPSGQRVTYIETIQNLPGPNGLTYRFRFVAPGIARAGLGLSIEDVAADMDYLCATFAVPRLPLVGPVPSQIIISLADRMLDFGTAAPEATQFFEAYRIEDGICIWEGF